MRATEFVTEIEAFPGSQYIGGAIPFVSTPNHIQSPDLTKKILRQARPLPSGNFKYAFITDPYEQDIKIVYLIAPNNEIVGALQLNDLYDDMYEVNKIDVLPQWRNQGVAKGLYGVVLAVMKKVLLSGGQQTEAGARNWLSLSQIPGVQVLGRVTVDKRQTDKVRPLLNNMMAQHVDKGPWLDYFVFPVKPDTSLPRLTAAFDRGLKLYHSGDKKSPVEANVEIKLMAMYRGSKAVNK